MISVVKIEKIYLRNYFFEEKKINIL